MRVVVTGGRDFADRHFVFHVLDSLLLSGPTSSFALGHGGCPTGADHSADLWATARGVVGTVYEALWKLHGHKAGPLRNQHMLEHFKPDLVIAFPGGRGTADCVRKARAMGIEVRECRP